MLSSLLRGSRFLRLAGALFDLLCATAALPLAYVARLGTLPDVTPPVIALHASFVAAAGVCFYAFGLNRGSWRYASIDDLIAIIKAVVLATLITSAIAFLVSRLDMLPRTVPFLTAVFLIVMMGGARFVYRVIKDRYIFRTFGDAGAGEPVLLVGYTDEAESFVRAMGRQRRSLYQIVGIIDNTDRHVGRRLHNVRVLGNLDDLAEVVEALRKRNILVSRLVVCPSRSSVETMEQIVETAADLGLQVFMLPNSAQLVANDGNAPEVPQAIRLEDLLGRTPARIDLAPVAAMLRGKAVLVTGGGGSIGSELVVQIARFAPREIVVVDSSEFNLYMVDQLVREAAPGVALRAVIGDVRDRKAIHDIMAEARPELVFHAAALKHVPLVEDNVVEGARTNVLGTINVADAAVASRARAFVMISTDKAVNPTNVMGATKRFAEAYCQSLDLAADNLTRFMTVRFGNVLGSTGSVVPLFTRQIAKGGPVTVTHPEMTRFFMTSREAIKLLLSASARGLATGDERGKIMVLDMGKQIRIVDLAHRMIQLAGLRPGVDVKIVFTGLRPGEKLYEEPLEANERLVDTENDWLHLAWPREVDDGRFTRAVARLAAACEQRHEGEVLNAIREIVPELVSGVPVIPPPPTAGRPISLDDARNRLRR